MSEPGPAGVPDRAREAPHPPGPEPRWNESWYVDFADDAGRGGFLRLGLLPHHGVAWVWAAWAGEQGTVVVRDHDVAMPRSGLEVRAGGLWADLVCETPMSHWTLGLEAFGLVYDDPADGWAGERGDRVPLGFDLEWEAAMPPFEHPQPAGRPGSGHYQHAGRVHGEVLVGERRMEFEGWGERDHAWGVRDWWDTGWHWAAFHVGGTSLSVARPDRPGPEHARGYVAAAGEDGHPLVWGQVETETDGAGLPVAAAYTLEEGRRARAEVTATVALLVPEPDGVRMSRMARALCRVETGEGTGTGWAEWLTP